MCARYRSWGLQNYRYLALYKGFFYRCEGGVFGPLSYHSGFLVGLYQLKPQGNQFKPSLELVASPTNSERALSVLYLGTVARYFGNDEYLESLAGIFRNRVIHWAWSLYVSVYD